MVNLYSNTFIRVFSVYFDTPSRAATYVAKKLCGSLYEMCALGLLSRLSCPGYGQFIVSRLSLPKWIKQPSSPEFNAAGILILCLCTNIVKAWDISRGKGWLSRYSDSLRAGRSGDRIPVEGSFSAPVQTGPGAYPASCTTGTGSFTGIKRPGRGVDHPPTSIAEVKERVELYLYSPSGPSWHVLG